MLISAAFLQWPHSVRRRYICRGGGHWSYLIRGSKISSLIAERCELVFLRRNHLVRCARPLYKQLDDNTLLVCDVCPGQPPESHQGSNRNSSRTPSQADWVKLIIFSCRSESISSAQQLSISTAATHHIQLNFTQDLFFFFLSLTTLMSPQSLLSRLA